MVINGKEISKSLKDGLAAKVVELNEKYGRTPNLVVILVGDDPGSVSYVTGKAKAATEVGIRNRTDRLPETTTEEELLALVDKYNNDDDVDGILVQLPLPKHIDSQKVIARITPDKDVDGFHPMNVAGLWLKEECIVPCTPKGIIKLLNETGVKIEGAEAVVVGRSNIVGLPVAKLLLDNNATVTIAHSRTKNLAEVTRRADILVVAIGKERLITADMIKPGAIVIDVGVNRSSVDGKLCGDVDYQEAQHVASHITPVPGGVGPMTIACLMENTVENFIRREERKN